MLVDGPLVNLYFAMVSDGACIWRGTPEYSLVPHVTDHTGTLGDGLLFQACPSSGSVVVLWVALHIGDLVEHGFARLSTCKLASKDSPANELMMSSWLDLPDDAGQRLAQ